MRLKNMLILASCLLLSLSAMAQEDCPAIVQTALEAVDSLCAETGRNQACYGNLALSAESREGAANLSFEQPGDLANLADVASLTLNAMDAENSTWGVALLRVQANLPETLPGQNVTMLLFGDVEISNRGGVSDETDTYGDMQAFYFRTGIGDAPCAEAPDSGILIQSPHDAEQISLNMNGVTLKLGSTAFVQGCPCSNLTISVLDGEGEVTVDDVTVTVPEGTQITIPLDDAGQPEGLPSYPQPYDAERIGTLPINALPEPIEVAEPVDAADAPLLFVVSSATLQTDPTERILYARPEGDFIAETQVTFSPDSNFQGAGLYAEFDTGGRIEFLLAYCLQDFEGCTGRILVFDALGSPGFGDLLAHEAIPFADSTVYLQIENTGDGTYIARYRTSPGAAWTDFASFVGSVVVTEVGILAQSASGSGDNPMGAPNIRAVFNDFTIRRP
jgi:hypothetical protein